MKHAGSNEVDVYSVHFPPLLNPALKALLSEKWVLRMASSTKIAALLAAQRIADSGIPTDSPRGSEGVDAIIRRTNSLGSGKGTPKGTPRGQLGRRKSTDSKVQRLLADFERRTAAGAQVPQNKPPPCRYVATPRGGLLQRVRNYLTAFCTAYTATRVEPTAARYVTLAPQRLITLPHECALFSEHTPKPSNV